MFLTFNCIHEEKPNEKWKHLFESTWNNYKKWFLSQGYQARTGYVTSVSKLEEYMPELLPIYHQIVALAGGGDLAARFLSSYNPPPYMSACSQIVWKGEESPVLIRNYDYSPYMLEGVLLYSNWLRPVIASSDCMWGILDGMNDAGLCLSLTFGGRKIVGEGFGIPLIMRYVIETCKTTEEAIKKFKHIPSHMSYNITILDAQGHFETLFLSPDRPTILTSSPIGTNHQSQIEWEAYANLTGTREREKFLRHCVEIQEDSQESLIRKFLRPPLYNMQFERGFGTLYTAAYWAKTKEMRIFWQQKQVEQSFDNFKEIKAVINLSQGFFGKFV